MKHTQEDEHLFIDSYFGNRTGAFLDIGANDGKTFSNTYALALRGWIGTSVEPVPGAFKKLQETVSGLQVQCIEAAVTTFVGRTKFQVASDSLVSSLHAEAKDAWASHGFEWEEIEVAAIDFPTLLGLSVIKKFDFISIDAEGHDLEILRQMDLKALGCQMLCIEHGGKQDEIKALCPGMKEVYNGGINLILVR